MKLSRSSPARGASPTRVLVPICLWMATVGNLALWKALTALPELGNLRGLLFAIAFGIGIAATLCGLISLLAWRWTFKPVLTLLLLVTAAATYYMLAYGVVIDPTMVVNVLQTDPKEARDVLSVWLGVALLVVGILPAVWVWRQKVEHGGVLRALFTNVVTLLVSLAVLSGALMLAFQDFSSVMRNHTQLRYLINPLNTVYALGDIAATPFKRNTRVRLPLGEDARVERAAGASAKPTLLLLVLGETARADHFTINGYDRPTSPRLQQAQVISQRKAWSCGTSTAASVPCMFSHLGREAYDARKVDHETLVDVLQRAGLAVLWINNQAGCKGVCDRAQQVSTGNLNLPGFCDKGECHDEVMLQDLEARISALPAERRQRGVVLVMHQMGSHGPAYYKRTPPAFKRFTPECASNALQDCAREQVVNAYDNTIAYTDHFLGQAIDWLKRREAMQPTAMLYVSDHGESLGENNLYLHGLPWRFAPEAQKRVPWMLWLSPTFARQQALDLNCLRGRLDVELSHDHYFHSVLALADVKTQAYDRPRDFYAPCRGGGKP